MPARVPIALPDEFACAMQQLSAEAEKSFSAPDAEDVGSQLNEFAHGLQSLEARLGSMERALTSRLDELVAKANEPAKQSEFAAQFQKMEEHVSALRNTETVNQRLFDSLHEELIKYRDGFLHESLQKPFIRDLVVLFDDLSRLSTQLTGSGAPESKPGAMAQWSANLENAIHSLLEMLHRLEVTEIESKEFVDRNIHRVVTYEPADFAEDEGRIVMRLKRGFLWRDQVLRAEEVVAKRFA